jgi:uncharacterized membrane protein YphA (DoxX/SURF4 family)
MGGFVPSRKKVSVVQSERPRSLFRKNRMTPEKSRSRASIARQTAYWLFTSLIALEMAVGSYWDVAGNPFVREVFTHLGLPYYLLTIIGIWKLPCAIVLLIPGFRRLKEWAYAGAFLTYSGAAVFHMCVGDGFSVWVDPLVICMFTVASWALRPSSRRWVPGGAGAPGGHSRARIVVYWIVTIMIAFSILSGGIAELTDHYAGTTVQGMLQLGYPVYFTRFLGYWKVAAGITLLVPRFPLIKEWAYAGIVFDLTGAFATHIFCHSAAFHLISLGVLIMLTMVSWRLRDYVFISYRSSTIPVL